MARHGRSYLLPSARRYDRPPRYAALPRVVDVEITATQTETLANPTVGLAYGRTITVTQTETVTVTLTVTRGPYLKYVALTPSYSNRDIRNYVTVTRAGGVAVTATDAASITSYGVRSYSLSTVASTDADSATTAARIIERYAQPELRFDGFTIAPRYQPDDLIPQALGREIGDRVTVIRTPQNVGSPIIKDGIIEGVTHTITPDDWHTAFNLSPEQWIGEP